MSKTVCVSLAMLHKHYGIGLEQASTRYGVIDYHEEDGNKYYDYYEHGILRCCDGEECEIVSENEEYTVLQSTSGDYDHKFQLSNKEMMIATFK